MYLHFLDGIVLNVGKLLIRAGEKAESSQIKIITEHQNKNKQISLYYLRFLFCFYFGA